jgi:hypothetical protein
MEGVSLTALLPMLNIAVSGGSGKFGSGVGKAVTTALQFIGITPTASVRQALQLLAAGTELRGRLWHNTHQLYERLAALGFRLGPEPTPVIAVYMAS